MIELDTNILMMMIEVRRGPVSALTASLSSAVLNYAARQGRPCCQAATLTPVSALTGDPAAVLH